MTKSVEPAPATEAETKPCKVCAEPIKKAARVCIHCESYQNWRSWLRVSESVLALLVALISVGTVFVPILVTALTPKNSDFIFSLQAAKVDQGFPTTWVLVSNNGTRAGTVSLAYLELGHEPQKRDPSFSDLQLTSDYLPVLIAAGESKLIPFKFTEQKILELLPKYSREMDMLGLLTVRYTNFQGERAESAIMELTGRPLFDAFRLINAETLDR